MESSVQKKSSGQALIEYLFVMIFIILLSIKIVNLFTDFMRDSMGNLGHVLTNYLTVGVCESKCFFGGYKNGFGGE